LGAAKALSDEDLLPSVISGSSGGAFVAGVLGTNTHDELQYFFDPANLVVEARRETRFMANLWPFGSNRLDIKDLQEMLERSIPDVTFAEAFEISGRWINISIAPYEQHQSSRLLNAITSPTVYVRKAIEASCAVPGLFPPVVLEAKSKSGQRRAYLPSRRWVDGSVTNDLPAKRLARLYGVNHYIASMVNPFALWFVQDPKDRQGIISTGLNAMIRSSQEWLRATQPLTNKLVRSMPNIERAYRSFYSLATQEYTGDITLRPRSRIFNPVRLLTPLTEKELMELIREGEQVTYPKIEMVRNCTKISRTLQEILRQYDQRALRYSHRVLRSNLDGSSGTAAKPAA
ncbi:MAG: DUF3336 domain-containing protein, partial [Gammaproteobacteria bacterium]|nr:DUF3336 domain-containing protein [Gammaproteobacteria bacterium]